MLLSLVYGCVTEKLEADASPVKVLTSALAPIHMEVLYIMPENERSAIATGVLHVQLNTLLKRHKPPTVIDTLASLLHEAGWEIVVSALEVATQAAADEEIGGAQFH